MAKEFRNNKKQINTRMIFADDYQREINTNAVKKIVRDFDPNVVNEPKVSFRDSKYWVFDGQHTIAALKMMNGGEDLMIECKVFFGMTYEDEARLFALQEGTVTKVKSEDKLRALREAGDEEVLGFIKATQSCGFACDFKKHHGKKALVCYGTAFGIYHKKGQEHYKALLTVINKAWKGEEHSTDNQIVSGLDLFMTHYAGAYDKDRLIKKLATTKPYEIVREGRANHFDNGARRYERAIFDLYNNGLREERRLEWKN